MNPPTLPTGPGAGADPLAQLRGLHLPEAVGAWPPAPGWWVLAGLAAALCVVLIAIVRRRRRSLARIALRELDGIAQRHSTAPDLQPLAAALSELLRRVALVRFGARAAALHGTAWKDFLAEHSPAARRASRARTRRASGALSSGAGELLALAPYSPPGSIAAIASGSNLDRDGLLAAARVWIRWNS